MPVSFAMGGFVFPQAAALPGKEIESMQSAVLSTKYRALILVLLFCFALAFSSETRKAVQLKHKILDNLIAPFCWSQLVSQRYSEAADPIRSKVHVLVTAGKSRAEIFDHFADRHGERILAALRAQGFNIQGYLLPWVVLIFGACWLFFVKRLKKASIAGNAPPANEHYISLGEKELRDMDR